MTSNSQAVSASLCFHPYAACISMLKDDGHCRISSSNSGSQPSSYPYQRVARQSRKRVQNYFNSVLEKYRIEFAEANGGPGREFDNYLYNPCYHLAFGYPSFLQTLIIDDFDPLFRLTTDLKFPLHQFSLLFSPTLESLGIPGFGKPLAANAPWIKDAGVCKWLTSPFVEIHDLLNHSRQGGFPRFASKRPLLAFSRFKLGGMAVLGDGLMLRKAIFRAIALRVSECLDAMNANIGSRQSQMLELDSRLSHKEVSVSLLDAQGPEEIGVYIACRNYSVAAALLVSIGGLTYRDLFAQGVAPSQLRAALNDTDVWKNVCRQKDFDSSIKAMENNHPCSASYSVFGVSEAYVQNRQFKKRIHKMPELKGKVEANIRAAVSCGHLGDFERNLRSALQAAPLPGEGATEWKKTPRWTVGKFDYDYSLGWSPVQKIPVISTHDLIERSLSVAGQLFTSNARNDRHETGLTDISTTLVVPYPAIDAGEWQLPPAASPEHRPWMLNLNATVKTLFGKKGDLSIKQLKQGLDRLRLPVRLQRTIKHFFNNYRHALNDSLIFDAALDIYDAVAVFHRLLTTDLIEFRDIWLDEKSTRFNLKYLELLGDSFASIEMVNALSDFVDALDNSLTHRMHHETYAEMREWTIDIRGGLTQMVHGANAAMMCSVGLFKWCVSNRFGNFSAARRDRGDGRQPPIGAVSRLTLHQVYVCERLKLIPGLPAELLITDFSIGHIFRPPELFNYLHEVGHCIYDSLCLQHPLKHRREDFENDVHTSNGVTHPEGVPDITASTAEGEEENKDVVLPPAVNQDNYLESVMDEYFARGFTQLFGFGKSQQDWKSGCAWAFSHFFSQGECANDLPKLHEKILELGISYQLIGDYLCKPEKPAATDLEKWALSQSEQTYELIGSMERYCPRIALMSQTPETKKFYIEQAILPRMKLLRESLTLTSLQLERIYDEFQKQKQKEQPWCFEDLRTAGEKEKGQPISTDEQLRRVIEHCFEAGETSLWTELAGEKSLGDDLVAVAALVKEYIRQQYEPWLTEKTRIYLPFVPKGTKSEPDFSYARKDEETGQLWADFQLTSATSRQFCSSPEARQARFRRDITLHRILWNISTRLRARRAASIFGVKPPGK